MTNVRKPETTTEAHTTLMINLIEKRKLNSTNLIRIVHLTHDVISFPWGFHYLTKNG